MIEIVPYKAFSASSGCRQIDAIFYEASNTQSFSSAAEQAAFHWRWLGRYLAEEPEHSFLAVTGQNCIVGYLAGSIADPAQRSEFDELEYFQVFAHLTARYPAHFHINVAHNLRATGVGTRLVSAFAAHAAAAGAAGIHIVTGKDARNVGFYRRNGFDALACTIHRGHEVILLVREVAPCKSI